ncbi:pre-toxin TG domain-containing protein [Enterococcus gilvus]|uniref:pre-toxin TG domain-containing protein n=1 Tax=Enterococcus gilvus TaxID=160453 RepID=UPI001C8B0BF5|nr:pre-toxin TG domain-containing protein [Enterococcus gilvus]MBX8936969.1 hypothetical protein [Enterococcus gilvus]
MENGKGPKVDIKRRVIGKGPHGETYVYEVYVDGIYDAEQSKRYNEIVQEANLSVLHFAGDLTPINDIYRLITGKDWLSGEKESRSEAALWLTLTAIPVSKLLQMAKEIRAGNKLLKGVALTEKEIGILNKAGYFNEVKKARVSWENIEKASESTPPKTDFGAENPVFGQDWNNYFKDKYGAGNVQWKPTSFDDIVANPERLYGSSKNEIKSILGEGWTEASYGSAGNGWKFTNGGDVMVFYHPGDGIHGGSYYGFSTGGTGKVKIVGEDYIDFSNDKATIIKFGGE